MLRKIIFGSTLLLASGSVFANTDYAQDFEESTFEDFDFDSEANLDEDIDPAKSDIDQVVDWHSLINSGNLEQDPSFQLINNKLVGIFNLKGFDHTKTKVVNTQRGFLSIGLLKSDSREGDEIELIMQTLNASSEQISVEFIEEENSLVVTVPINTNPEELTVHFRKTLEELSFYKALQGIETRESSSDSAKEDL